MSNHSPLTNESITPSCPESEPDHDASRYHYLRTLKGPAQFTCFWIAIALPFVHVPLLAQGLGDPSHTLAFLVLLAVNVVALYVGHGYKQS